ncbi:unnamed protein product, partial [Brassica oleracea var. botrytis]
IRSATWCIIFCVLIFLVMSDGKGPKEKKEPNNLCPRIEDLEGDCKVDGPKGCINYMRKTYKANMIIAYMTTSTCYIKSNVFANVPYDVMTSFHLKLVK